MQQHLNLRCCQRGVTSGPEFEPPLGETFLAQAKSLPVISKQLQRGPATINEQKNGAIQGVLPKL